MKQLTIIIPTYKKPKSLERLLYSIDKCCDCNLTQVIIVSDDGSDVDTKHTFVRCGNATGAIMPIWKGVLMADTPYVGVLGDDCEIITEGIDEMVCSAPTGVVIGLNDGIQQGRAHPFMLRQYWLTGFGLAPCYRHYHADTELYRLACYHDYWYYMKDAKIKHHHIISLSPSKNLIGHSLPPSLACFCTSV